MTADDLGLPSIDIELRVTIVEPGSGAATTCSAIAWARKHPLVVADALKHQRESRGELQLTGSPEAGTLTVTAADGRPMIALAWETAAVSA